MFIFILLIIHFKLYIMKKPLLSIVLMIVTLNMVQSQTIGTTFVNDGVKYEITSLHPNEIEIIGYDVSPSQTITSWGLYNSYSYEYDMYFDLVGIEENMFIPASITTIYVYSSTLQLNTSVFLGADNLTSIIFDVDNEYFTSDEYAVYSKDLTILYHVFATNDVFVLPPTVTHIEDDATYSFNGRFDSDFQNVQYLGKNAVSGTRLNSFIDIAHITELPGGVFSNTTGLDSIHVCTSSGMLSEYLFLGSSVRSIVLRDETTHINYFTFAYANNLQSIYVESTNAVSYHEYAFFGGVDFLTDVTVYVISEAFSKYTDTGNIVIFDSSILEDDIDYGTVVSLRNTETNHMIVSSAGSTITINGQYDTVSVYSISGQFVGMYTYTTNIHVKCGIYVVIVDNIRHKVIVR